MELEHFFQCPYCWEEISMILDQSVYQQTYIEDCEVCCNPIEITPIFEEGALASFSAQSIEQ
ncbi:CPXCG motif-containing cysteine-rich protein [Polaribacter atrinae]|uniref:CPXCG motif-containing cysteine-rich protein n=1 Tax=Polaribacter atrinae TaxID=1333662 RepID=UPI002491B729|nr:CPXCG motif-containing cysteine-rich protein [Polaribacter atrinae]